jgi:hypothetical protein
VRAIAPSVNCVCQARLIDGHALHPQGRAMRYMVAVAIALWIQALPGTAQPEDRTQIVDFMRALQADHIKHNVPEPRDFNGLLQRDVKAFFVTKGMKNPTVTIDLLRSGPTQSGMSYPKFYLWVTANTAGKDVAVGAMKVDAVQKNKFRVSKFLQIDDIRADPDQLNTTFPAALIRSIKERCGIPR